MQVANIQEPFLLFLQLVHVSTSYDAIHVYRIEDGKRAEHKAIRDDLSFMMQLGLAGPALLRQTNTLGHNIL